GGDAGTRGAHADAGRTSAPGRARDSHRISRPRRAREVGRGSRGDARARQPAPLAGERRDRVDAASPRRTAPSVRAHARSPPRAAEPDLLAPPTRGTHSDYECAEVRRRSRASGGGRPERGAGEAYSAGGGHGPDTREPPRPLQLDRGGAGWSPVCREASGPGW